MGGNAGSKKHWMGVGHVTDGRSTLSQLIAHFGNLFIAFCHVQLATPTPKGEREKGIDSFSQ